MVVNSFTKKLKPLKRLGIDTCCFIYHFEGHAKYGPLAQKLFSKLEEGGEGFTSTITLAELLAKPKIARNGPLRSELRLKFLSTPNLTIVPPDLFICEQAAIFKAKYGLLLPDALQLATAYLTGTEIFVSNDKKLRRVEEITTLSLSDYC